MKTLTDIIGIRWYNRLESIAKQIVDYRVYNGSSVFRNERFDGISQILIDEIEVNVKDSFTNDIWSERISWEEISQFRKNNWKKWFNFKWKKTS
jgi:hypothetical protein